MSVHTAQMLQILLYHYILQTYIRYSVNASVCVLKLYCAFYAARRDATLCLKYVLYYKILHVGITNYLFKMYTHGCHRYGRGAQQGGTSFDGLKILVLVLCLILLVMLSHFLLIYASM